MNWYSIFAIYFLFWFLALFLVLPFSARTSVEAGEELVPGQAESAPQHFPAGRIALRTTIVSAALFALFYLNYIFGWVTPEMLDYWG
ncbi:DUF1467 family protein [Sphingomonas sp.]|uniref:DUF1467 family protein n=1 Tax=Sphingomonas sp. TaxID=28214 RepID=UPI001EB2FB89|nr:DUF1467 family protein [Sphingomonas sp.]MBX3594528.1 DUF1467 family protein [Sphingomonas sp.]